MTAGRYISEAPGQQIGAAQPVAFLNNAPPTEFAAADPMAHSVRGVGGTNQVGTPDVYQKLTDPMKIALIPPIDIRANLKHLVVPTSITNHRTKKISFFLSSSKNMIKWSVPDKPVLGAPPWRKRRPNSPRRPWLVSLAISTRLNSPMSTVVFADQLAQLTPTSRQAKLAVIARALGLDLPAPVLDGA